MSNLIDANFFYFLLFLGSISILLTKVFVKKYIQLNATTINHPPSPPELPIIGHLHLLSGQIHKSFQTLSLRYGPLMKLRVGASTSYIVSNASVAKEIFKTHDLNFSYRPTFGSSEHSIYEGPSLVTAEYGTYWRFLKKICMEVILSAPQLRQYASIRNEEKSKMIQILVQCSEKGEACDIGNMLMNFTNNVICRMTISTTCSSTNDESAEIREFLDGFTKIGGRLALGEILGPLNKFDILGVGRRLRSLMLRYDRLVDRLMTEREKERDGGNFRQKKDMMDILLDIMKDESAEVKLTRDNIKAFFMDIFIAGTETTSKVIMWTLAEIINNPNVCSKLRDEINTIVGMGRLVEESDVPNLPYLQAVLKETLRLHAIVPFIIRKCKEDCKISGYFLPAGSRILVNVFAIMQDENSWENPMEYIPERFLGSSVDMKGSDFHFLPFGSGRRRCPGLGLSYTVMHVTVAILVQCFDWKTYGNKKIEMKQGSGFTMGMAAPLVCFPVLRVNPSEINL